MLLLKIILTISFGFILYQDIKERQVYWFLFPIVGVCAGFLFFFETLLELFFTAVLLNLVFVSILIFIVFLYSKFKLKTTLNYAFGLGDIFFFFAIACSFSTVSFITIFSCALFFSLLIQIVTKSKNTTVPLAGYMSLFFGITYLGFWCGIINSVYQI